MWKLIGKQHKHTEQLYNNKMHEHVLGLRAGVFVSRCPC